MGIFSSLTKKALKVAVIYATKQVVTKVAGKAKDMVVRKRAK